MTLPPTWQVTPITVVVVVLAVAYGIGLRRLARRERPERTLSRLRRSWAFYSGCAILVFVASGPLERWSMAHLTVHMIVHVLEMFFLPPLLMAGAPTTPLRFALPVDRRRRLLRAYYLGRAAAPLRGGLRFLARPVVAVVAFNVVMVTWHLPVVFDWAAWHGFVMDWLMGPSFVLSGWLFWRVVLPAAPYKPRGTTLVQVAGVVGTALEMLVLAMAMSIFTDHAWYSMNVVMEGRAAALTDQRHAAAILWVCSDLWAVPAIILIAYRAWRDDQGRLEPADQVLEHV